MTLLSVNVDHVATVRQARGVGYPQPVEAARIAEAAGAAGITIHLRSDRRHIQDADLFSLRQEVKGKLNLEMAATDEMLTIALQAAPHQVTLVPERPEEITTEGGLDLVSCGREVSRIASRLTAGGITVSVFIDPDREQLTALSSLDGEAVEGFEINTDRYTRATETESRRNELEKIAVAAAEGEKRGFRIYAGHGLTVDNVGEVAAMPQIEELNIGHAIVARAILIGMEAAVGEMLQAMAAKRF